MSRHLYIAYSNLHLLFAQALALGQERDDRKDLWLGTQIAGSPLEQLYRHMLMRDLWREVAPLSLHRSLAFPIGRILLRNPVSSTRRWFSARAEMQSLKMKVCEQYDELWVPHPDDSVCRLLAEQMHRCGKKVHFYEEGLGVYLMHNAPMASKKWHQKIYTAARSAIAQLLGVGALYRPLSPHLDEAWLTLPNTPTIFPAELPVMDLKTRFHRKYIETLVSTSSMGSVIPQAASHYPTEPFLLLLCSVEIEDHWFTVEEYHAPLLVYLRGFQGKVATIAIKPHPRTQKAVLDQLLEKVRALGFQCATVREEFPVPIELLFPTINCVAVVGGISSPLVYLPQLYGVPTHSIVPGIDVRTLSLRSAAYVRMSKNLYGSPEKPTPR